MKNRMQEVNQWDVKQCYILNFGEQKAEAETRDQFQTRALALSNISTPQSKLGKQSGPSLCAQTMLVGLKLLAKADELWLFLEDCLNFLQQPLKSLNSKFTNFRQNW